MAEARHGRSVAAPRRFSKSGSRTGRGLLSGGEQQARAVARALVMRPRSCWPRTDGDLDEQTADSLHALLREMHQAYGLTS